MYGRSARDPANLSIELMPCVRSDGTRLGEACENTNGESLGRFDLRIASLLLSLLASVVTAGEGIIPLDRRIHAELVRTLEAPAEQAMRMPTDVAVDRAGRVYVADGVNDRIVAFAEDGAFDRVISTPGGKQLRRPVGLAVDAADRLWIADTGQHRLVVVSPDGTFVESIKLPPAGPQKPTDPTDVLVTPDGKRVYVVDNDNDRILIRDDGQAQWISVGRTGESLGQLQWPFMICTGQQGDVFISEAIGARVQRLSAANRWAGRISRWGVELGSLYRPKGVAVDRNGRLFVSDSSLSVVQVFTPRGRLAGVLTVKNGAPVRFSHPMGMCFDANGRLYVVELKANRVAVFAVIDEHVPASQASTRLGAEGSRP